MNFDDISSLRDFVISYVDRAISTMFGWTRVSNSSPMGDADFVQVEDSATSQRPVRRIEPWGHRGRPTSKARAFWMRLGSSNIFFIGVSPTRGYGPEDLAEGETALYCSRVDTEVRLDQNGNVKIKVPGGQQINFQNGTNGVARVGDSVDASGTLGSGMVNWMGQVSAALGIVTTPTAIGTISSGSSTVKAGN